jgi:hypothetical protein
MSLPSRSAKLIGFWGLAYLAQLLFFCWGKYVIEHIVVNIHTAVFHPSGSPRGFLWHHPFPFAAGIGLVLGFLPLHVLAAITGTLSRAPAEEWRKLWQMTKPWVPIPFVILFVLTISSYVAAEGNTPSAWQSFFATPCSLDALHVLVYRNGCANQLLFTAPLVCALAYSATSLFESRRNLSDPGLVTGTSGNISEIA